MTLEQFSKVHALDCILQHLECAGKDCRHREQMRAKIALRHINAWIKEGEELYKYDEATVYFTPPTTTF